MTDIRRKSAMTVLVAAILLCSLPALVRAVSAGETAGTDRSPACFLVPSESLHAVEAGEFVEVTICQRPLYDERFPVIHRSGSEQYSFDFRAPDDVELPVGQRSFIDQTIALIETP